MRRLLVCVLAWPEAEGPGPVLARQHSSTEKAHHTYICEGNVRKITCGKGRLTTLEEAQP